MFSGSNHKFWILLADLRKQPILVRGMQEIWGDLKIPFLVCYVTTHVISPYLSLPIGKTCFVALNPFGKCLYKENFSIRSILLSKWDIIQLALDPGAGQTKSVICFPPDFLLGKNRVRQQVKDRRMSKSQWEGDCLPILQRMWCSFYALKADSFLLITLRLTLSLRNFGSRPCLAYFLLQDSMASVIFAPFSCRHVHSWVLQPGFHYFSAEEKLYLCLLFPFKKSQQNLEILEFLEIPEVKVQQLRRS